MTKFKNQLLRHCTLALMMACIFSTSGMTYADPLAIDRVIAVVNDGVIFSSQFEERVYAVKLQAKSVQDQLPDQMLRQQILERLIVESLQLQLAEKVGITINNDELQNALLSIARQNDTDISGLRAKIEAEGLSFKNFTKNIEQELIMQRVQQAALSKRVVVSDQDVTNFLNSEEGKLRSSTDYHLAHIVIPVNDENNEAEMSQAAMLAKQIYEQANNPDSPSNFSALARHFSKVDDANEGGDLGWRKKSDIPSLYTDKIDQIESGTVAEPFFGGGAFHILKMLEKRGQKEQWITQTKSRHILIKPSIIRSEDEAVALLQNLRQKILAGEDFAIIAKKYSEDYASALKGGDLGWMGPGQLVTQFQQAMDETPVNNISEPFKTQYGWHIVQVQERRNQNIGDERLKQSAKNFLMQRRFEEELPLWLKEIRDEAYVDIKE